MGSFFPIIVATLVLFLLLAAVLLVPIYRFLQREEEASKHWTPEELARRVREKQHGPNGHPPDAARERPPKAE